MKNALTRKFRCPISCPRCGRQLRPIRLRLVRGHRCLTGCGTWLEPSESDLSTDRFARVTVSPARDVAPPRALSRLAS